MQIGHVSSVDLPAYVPLPPPHACLGPVEAIWEEIDPGVALIRVHGGTADDRALVHHLLRIELAHHGIEHAQFEPGELARTAGWTDIEQKSKRLMDSGQVHVLRNSRQFVAGHVIGDHGEYDCEFSRDDPASWTITGWRCECPWNQYAFQRTRQWKKYEARPCAHVLGLFWASRRLPLDEAIVPGDKLPRGVKGFPGQGPDNLGIQQQLFAPPDAGQFTQPFEPPEPTGPAPGPPPAPGAPGPSEAPPGPSAGPPGALGPPDLSVIPPQPLMPGEQMPLPVPGTTPGGMASPPNAVSVPGAKVPTPFNPIQFPGGTYSYDRANHTSGRGTTLLASDSTDQQASGTQPDFPTVGVGDFFAGAIHEDDGRPERFALEQSGFVDGALHRAQAAYSAVQTYYHGTNVALRPGDTIRPQALSGSPTEFANSGYYDPYVIYLTTEDHLAERYAVGRAGRLGGEPHVYEVRPIGSCYPDPEAESGFGTDQHCALSGEVIQEIPLPGLVEWRDGSMKRRSAQAQFENGMRVKLLTAQVGMAEGKSEAHGAGQYREIPAGSEGEVLSQDALTNWVEVIFPLHQSGPMEPYHVRSFLDAKELKIIAYPPGSPFVKRLGPHS